jgi:hypothetical protein
MSNRNHFQRCAQWDHNWPQQTFSLLDSREVEIFGDPSKDPSHWWKAFAVASYLPEFRISDLLFNSTNLCESVATGLFSRVATPPPFGQNYMTYAGKVITKAIMESIGNINFLANELFGMLTKFLKIGGYGTLQFSEDCIQVASEVYWNFEANAAKLGLTDRRLGRFAS